MFGGVIKILGRFEIDLNRIIKNKNIQIVKLKNKFKCGIL